MPKRTNEFQQLIAQIQSHLDSGSTVEESAMLPDSYDHAQREVDVVVSGHVGGQPVTVSIECRDRQRTSDVTWVQEMQAKHALLPTNVLVLASRSSFSEQALSKAKLYGIRCVVVDEIGAQSSDRLFPDVQSLWGKAWLCAIVRFPVVVCNAAGENKSIELQPNDVIFEGNGGEHYAAIDVANALLKSPAFVEKMFELAQPEHASLIFQIPRPTHRQERLYVKAGGTMSEIMDLQVHARCTVTVDQFPLRHGAIGTMRLTWGTVNLLGSPAMVVTTSEEGQAPKMSIRPVGGPVSKVVSIDRP